MRTKLYGLLLMGTAMTAALSAQAQTRAHQEVDLAVTYSTEHSNLVGGGTFWRQGGSLELSAVAFHGFGLALNASGNRIGNINGTGINLTAVTTTFGPRYTWSPAARKLAIFNQKKLAIFGQGLIGESHGLDSVFPNASGVETSYDSFALQVGGGADWRIGKHFALRPIQADWIRTQFPNSTTNVQNSLRLGAGIVVRLDR